MPQAFPKRRATVSSAVLLALAATTALCWAGLGLQGKAKPPAEKAAPQKPTTPPSATTKPATAKPAVEKSATENRTTDKPKAEKPNANKPVAPNSAPQKKGDREKSGDRVSTTSSVEKLLPAKPVFLYVWDGSEAHQKSWDETGFQKAFVGSGLYQSVEKLMRLAFQNSVGPTETVFGEIAGQALVKGASISVSLISISDQPAVQVTLVLPGAADRAKVLNEALSDFSELKVETIFDRQVTRAALPFADGFEVGWWTEGGHLVVAGGLQAIEAALDVAAGKTPNLTSNPMVQKLRKSDDFDVAAVSFVDFKALLDVVRNWDLPPLPGSDKPPVKVGEFLKIAGVDKVGFLTERWGFRGEAIWIESDLEAPAPLTGLLSLYDQKPLTLQELPTLPAGCEYFMLARHDLSKTFASLISMAGLVADKIAPADAPPLSDTLNIVNDAVGIDLQTDLMNPLGDTMALYVEGAGLVPAGVLLLKLDESKKVLESLVKLENKVKENTVGVPDLELREKVTLGRTLHIVQISQQAFVSPTWVVDKDWLVIGTTPQSVEAYLKRVDGKLSKWKPPADIADAQKMLPEKFATFYYFDPRGALKYGLGLAPTGIAMLEERSKFAQPPRLGSDEEQKEAPKFPLTPEDIPVAEEITGPLFPSIGNCTVDATGIHWRNRNSIPGLLIPGIPGGTGGVDSFYSIASNASMFLLSFRTVNFEAPPAVRDAN